MMNRLMSVGRTKLMDQIVNDVAIIAGSLTPTAPSRMSPTVSRTPSLPKNKEGIRIEIKYNCETARMRFTETGTPKAMNTSEN